MCSLSVIPTIPGIPTDLSTIECALTSISSYLYLTQFNSNSYVEAYPYDTTFMHVSRNQQALASSLMVHSFQNCLIRAFNQIGAASMKVLPVEMVNFVKYVDAFCETLRRHCEGTFVP
jgi:hypothetical protein